MRVASGRLAGSGQLEPGYFCQDFLFDHPLEKMNRDAFIERLAHTGTWSSVSSLALVEGEHGAAMMVDATDDVTGLRHRLAWAATYRGDQVERILVVSARLP
jgi:hypothetical protein